MNIRNSRMRILCQLAAIACPVAVALAAAPVALAQVTPTTQAVSPTPRPIEWGRPVEQKCFFLLSILSDDPKAKAAVLGSRELTRVAESRHEALSRAIAGADVKTLITPAKWIDDQIKAAGDGLHRALFQDQTNRPIGAQVARQLRESGLYFREQSLSDEDLITHAWEKEARGINQMLAVYGAGDAPQYPRIDSISFKPDSPEWIAKSRDAVKEILDNKTGTELFFFDSMQLALKLMKLNDRDEAGRFEPMSRGENKAAVDRVPGLDWKKFKYSCILVPGIGPEEADTSLSSGGKANCELAAAAFHQGTAPFILVSGGYVHPNKTRFCEAVEMRRELIEKLHIPADAVVIDPHARHTTTNLRNAARLLYRYGMPMDLPALVVSNTSQIRMIASTGFTKRCERELGYQPARIGKGLSDTSVEITFSLDSLEADSLSPLDP